MGPKLSNADSATLLGVYLNDHLAGARGGLALARRCLDRNRATRLGSDLNVIVAEIRQDRATLQDVMEHLGVATDHVKQATAVLAERVGRLKLNGQILGYSPLSRLVELEGLCAGVDAKRSLWRSLERIAPSRPELGPFDLASLADRAERQRQTLEEHRLEAAEQVFTAG